MRLRQRRARLLRLSRTIADDGSPAATVGTWSVTFTVFAAFVGAAAYEVCVLHDGEPVYARTFTAPGSAERETDDYLKDMLAAGRSLHSVAK